MCRYFYKILVLLTILSLGFAVINDLPPYIKKCKLNDPNLNDCLLKKTDEVRPYLIKGIPELGLQSIDPLHVPEISLKQGGGAIYASAKLTNVVLIGLRNYDFSKFEFDYPNLQFFVEAKNKEQILTADLFISGRILSIPIEGNGKFSGNLSSIAFTGYQKLKKIQKNGEDYLDPIHTNMTSTVTDPKIEISGLFDDNKEINELAAKTIQDNIDVLFEEFKPVFEEAQAKIFEGVVAKSLLGNIPLKNLFD